MMVLDRRVTDSGDDWRQATCMGALVFLATTF
jgi:hypothetical protein